MAPVISGWGDRFGYVNHFDACYEPFACVVDMVYRQCRP